MNIHWTLFIRRIIVRWFQIQYVDTLEPLYKMIRYIRWFQIQYEDILEPLNKIIPYKMVSYTGI